MICIKKYSSTDQSGIKSVMTAPEALRQAYRGHHQPKEVAVGHPEHYYVNGRLDSRRSPRLVCISYPNCVTRPIELRRQGDEM